VENAGGAKRPGSGSLLGLQLIAFDACTENIREHWDKYKHKTSNTVSRGETADTMRDQRSRGRQHQHAKPSSTILSEVGNGVDGGRSIPSVRFKGVTAVDVNEIGC